VRKSLFVVASGGALAFAFAGAVGAPGVAWGSSAQAAPPTIRDTNAQFVHGKMWAPGDPPVITRSLQAPDGTPVIRDSLQAPAAPPTIRDSKVTGPPDTPTVRGSTAQSGHPGLKKLWAPGDPPVITHSLTAPPGTPIIRDSKVTAPPDPPVIKRSLTGPGSPGSIIFSARTGDPDDGGQVFAARTSDPDDGGQ
jgi:hypothetical protein